MKVRQGRHNDRCLYIQSGDQPDDSDEYLAAVIDPGEAKFVCDVVNGGRQPGERYYILDFVLCRYRSGSTYGRTAGIVFSQQRGDWLVSVLNGESA